MNLLRVSHGQGLLSFRKDELTMELEQGVMPLGLNEMRRWLIRFTNVEYWTTPAACTLMEALALAVLETRERGYIYFRVIGPYDSEDIGLYGQERER